MAVVRIRRDSETPLLFRAQAMAAPPDTAFMAEGSPIAVRLPRRLALQELVHGGTMASI